MDDVSQVVLKNLKQGCEYLWEITIVNLIWTFVIVKKIFQFFIPPELKSLRGEVILITGAGNGIGRQIALNLGNLGAKLVCWDIDSKANSTLVTELCNSGTKAYNYTVDISDMAAIKEASAKVRKEVGEVTMVVNNAGIIPNGNFLQMRSEVEEKMLRVNVLSHFQILREFLTGMVEKDHGHIVTVASIASFFPARELTTYTACKHANYGFIEALKQELEASPFDTSNIRFTTVYPCLVSTRVMNGVTLKSKFASSLPVVTPEFAGAEIVKGIRQNVEHLFIPKIAAALPLFQALIPTEVKNRLQKSIFKVDVIRSETFNNNNYC